MPGFEFSQRLEDRRQMLRGNFLFVEEIAKGNDGGDQFFLFLLDRPIGNLSEVCDRLRFHFGLICFSGKHCQMRQIPGLVVSVFGCVALTFELLHDAQRFARIVF